MQFVPLVERDEKGCLTAGSVTAEDWGHFLNTVFDIWVREDITRISIPLFDETLNRWCGRTGQTNRQTISQMSVRCQSCSLLQFYRGDFALHFVMIAARVDCVQAIKLSLTTRLRICALCATC